MSATDVSAFVGTYPFRALPHNGIDWLLTQMDRVRIERAWVGHLSTPLFTDPAPGNAELRTMLEGHGDRLFAIPTVDPSLPSFRAEIQQAADRDASAIRVYPMHASVEPTGTVMTELVSMAVSVRLPVVLTVRFEDVRQRHPLDVAADLPPGAVRSLARLDPGVRLLVTHADRSFVEEVHFGLTPEEAARVLWDVSWIWGPPEDHLALLLGTVGTERFTFGTGMPLRIPDASIAKLDLLDLTIEQRAKIMGQNLERWSGAAR